MLRRQRSPASSDPLNAGLRLARRHLRHRSIGSRVRQGSRPTRRTRGKQQGEGHRAARHGAARVRQPRLARTDPGDGRLRRRDPRTARRIRLHLPARRAGARHGGAAGTRQRTPARRQPRGGDHRRADRLAQPARADAGPRRRGCQQRCRPAADPRALRPRRLQALQRHLRASRRRCPAGTAGRAPARDRQRASARRTAWAATSSACWCRRAPRPANESCATPPTR